MKVHIFMICLLGTMYAEITPEKEYELIEACGKKTTVTLAEALQELTVNVTEPVFGPDFIKHVSALEKTQKDGEYIEKWPNGNVKLRVGFKNGKPDGHFHGYYENGIEAFKGFFKEGLKQGIHMAFFPNEPDRLSRYGRIISYNFEGQLDGEQTGYYADRKKGLLKTLATYKKGKPDGHLEMIFENKAVWRDYKNGKLLKTGERLK